MTILNLKPPPDLAIDSVDAFFPTVLFRVTNFLPLSSQNRRGVALAVSISAAVVVSPGVDGGSDFATAHRKFASLSQINSRLAGRRTSRKARVFRQYSCPFFLNEVNMGNEVTIQQSIPKANAQTTDQFVSAPALAYAGDVIERRYWQGEKTDILDESNQAGVE